MKIKNLVGNRDFYKKVFLVAVPIMLQNGITNFVGLLDNIMVGRLGTEQMSGVSIVNQLQFVFFLCIFGAIGGTGIFTAQYFGQKNDEGIQNTFRFKLILGFIILAIFFVLFVFWDEPLISLYLHDANTGGDLAATLKYGKTYMSIMLVGLFPVVIEQVYASTLRECGETVVPMTASIIAVLVNLILNYILIFGNFHAPRLGVAGAAYATVISRFVSMLVLVFWSHSHKEKYTYMSGLYKRFTVPLSLCKKMFVMAFPLIVNETLWAAGIAASTQIYSVRGLSVVAGLNICSTINNVFNIAFIAMGDAVAIMVGQLLGAGKLKEAKDTAYKIIAFSVFICLCIGSILYILAPYFPMVFNTGADVKSIATGLIRVSAVVMPIAGFLHPVYFAIRSGGKTVITFLFDSVFLWVISVPFAYVLINHTALSILIVFFLVEFSNIIKCIVGAAILKSGVWMQNLVK